MQILKCSYFVSVVKYILYLINMKLFIFKFYSQIGGGDIVRQNSYQLYTKSSLLQYERCRIVGTTSMAYDCSQEISNVNR